MLYLILIGAGQIRPPVLAGDLRKLSEFVLGLTGTDELRSSAGQASTP